VTHVLLPVLVLARRADVAAAIGSALVAKAADSGHRRIAVGLGRPAETVRGWLRRFAGRIEAVRVVFTGWCPGAVPDPVLPGPAGRRGRTRSPRLPRRRARWARGLASVRCRSGWLRRRSRAGGCSPRLAG
jgi:hypothetical protein